MIMVITTKRVGWAGNVKSMLGVRNACQCLVRQREGKTRFGGGGRKEYTSIKMGVNHLAPEFYIRILAHLYVKCE
jgi:hypothetical protein